MFLVWHYLFSNYIFRQKYVDLPDPCYKLCFVGLNIFPPYQEMFATEIVQIFKWCQIDWCPRHAGQFSAVNVVKVINIGNTLLINQMLTSSVSWLAPFCFCYFFGWEELQLEIRVSFKLRKFKRRMRFGLKWRKSLSCMLRNISMLCK